MDLRETPEEAAFRRELRRWIDENLPSELRTGGGCDEFAPANYEWSRRLAEAGYAALSWPEEYGGSELPRSFQAIVAEELVRHEAPPHVNGMGISMAGPVIIEHGTDFQKARFLPPIPTAEEIWCQGFSEPDAGSDLAAIRSLGKVVGDRLMITGQKVWSSGAHFADWCMLLVVTDPHAPRYRNLSFVLLDMRSPGVDVRPLPQVTGEAEFNEIFLEDVAVPLDHVVGGLGNGWAVAMTTLSHERVMYGFHSAGRLETALARLIALAKERGTNCQIRDQIAQRWIELQALKMTNYRVLAGLEATGDPGPAGTILKLHWSESNQRLMKLALELHGADAQLLDEEDRWYHDFWRGRGNTIEGGTSEIMRNIVAERVLGLPRSR
jgi:alkylation response protein AidB-like acyl-CoA dehydrogenase